MCNCFNTSKQYYIEGPRKQKNISINLIEVNWAVHTYFNIGTWPVLIGCATSLVSTFAV
jgi:hypothetical protein